MAANFTDWVAICETKARYCRCLDTKDWDGYADVFTEDLVLDTSPAGGYKVEGRDEAIRMIRQSVETARTAHQVHNPEISFTDDGQGATVIWAMNDRVAWGKDRIEAMRDLGHTGYGHYREHYVKCADGKWRIKHQELSYLQFDVIPLPSQPEA
jgi:ketosteroid isomerase-like protein